MAMKVLPPGFRFHPTDVELLKYYLKKKILGRPYFESIQEVNIYELDPWDLPGLSCLQTGDQKWYFFCPRERKYVHGDRAKRSTPGGFWKTTGKDRPVMDNDGPVGMIKTLIFHTGRPPGGSRTDWVMHEYRLEDRDLAAKGIPQDTYVVCAIFEKGGLGPRNGAQYGAPFKEEDWEDDGISFCLPLDQLFAARGSAQALMPLQEEQQDHFARNQDEAYNNLSESIVALGSPPPALAASETVLPEPSMPVLSTPTTAINHVNEAIMEDAVNDTIADGMDFDEFLDMITSSPANNYYQETQTTAPATNNGAAALAPTAAEGDGFFADLPELDVGLDVNLGSGDGFGFNGNYYPQTDGFVELHDLGGQQLAAVPTFPENLQGGIDTGNADDQYPVDWDSLDVFLKGIDGRNS